MLGLVQFDQKLCCLVGCTVCRRLTLALYYILEAKFTLLATQMDRVQLKLESMEVVRDAWI